MNTHTSWDCGKSIILSHVLVCILAIALVLLDIFGFWICKWLLSILPHAAPSFAVLMVCLYSCSIPAYLLLYRMHRLLTNLRQEQVFIPENVSHLRCVSYCCFGAGLICLMGSFCFPSLLVITLAAGFVGLIVRIVKNVFQQAISMKDELDLTV